MVKKGVAKNDVAKFSQLQHKIKSFLRVSTSDTDIRFKKSFLARSFQIYYGDIYLTFDY